MKRPSLPKVQVRNRKETDEAKKSAIAEAERQMLDALRQHIADAEQIADVGERIFKLEELKGNIRSLRTTHKDELFSVLEDKAKKGDNLVWGVGATGGLATGVFTGVSVLAGTSTVATTLASAALFGTIATVAAVPAAIGIGGGLAVRHYYRKKKKGREEETSSFFKDMEQIETGIDDKIKAITANTSLEELAASKRWTDLSKMERVSERFTAAAAINMKAAILGEVKEEVQEVKAEEPTPVPAVEADEKPADTAKKDEDKKPPSYLIFKKL